MYFVEARHDFLWMINTDDGSDPVKVVALNDTAMHPLRLAKARDKLYFTDWEERYVDRLFYIFLTQLS